MQISSFQHKPLTATSDGHNFQDGLEATLFLKPILGILCVGSHVFQGPVGRELVVLGFPSTINGNRDTDKMTAIRQSAPQTATASTPLFALERAGSLFLEQRRAPSIHPFSLSTRLNILLNQPYLLCIGNSASCTIAVHLNTSS